MVDVLNTGTTKDNRTSGGELKHMLRSRLLSVLEGSNDLLSGLSSRLESALSLSSEHAHDDSSITTTTIPTADETENLTSRKLRLPQFGPSLPYEDYAARARKRKNQDDKSHASSTDSEPVRITELKASGPDPYEKLKYKTGMMYNFL